MAYRSDNADSVSRGWDINFVEKTGINSGYVSCISDLDKVLKDYELCTKSKFIPIKNDALFGKESAVDLKQLKFEIRWADTQSNAVPQIPFSGVPFMIVGKKKLECHQGKDRNKKKKEKWKRSAENVTDHAFQRKRKHAQQTKKKECPAQIKMRHIIRFPEFEASQTLKSRHDKDKISGNIKAAINTGKDIKLEHQYHINLSPEHEHRNHFRGEAACIIHPLDEDLRKEIQVMVSENNITSPTHMKILLEVHLKKVMFQGQPLPVRTNKRFWPSMKDIRNHMALALMRHRSSNVDQSFRPNDWEKFIKMASSPKASEINIHNRRGAAAIETDPACDEQTLLSTLRDAVPYKIPERSLVNLLFLLMSHLVLQGLVNIGTDPTECDREGDAAMKKLQACIAKMNSSEQNIKRGTKRIVEQSFPKHVTFVTETSVRKKKVRLAEESTSPLPQGGLKNPGGRNLCFINSLLQCLRLTDLHRVLAFHNICGNMECFVCELNQFIKEGPITAEELCVKMEGFWKDYKIGDQQDSHECWQKMMEEVNKICFGNNQNLQRTSVEQEIFQGVEKSTVKCMNCGIKTSKMEWFTDISVSIEKAQNTTHAIKDYFREEEVDFKCSRCGKDASALKCSKLIKIPKNVILHLKRFCGSRRKNTKKIDIDLEIYLRDYVEKSLKLEDKADLFGVIVHQGQTVNNGHYYAFVRFGGQWFMLNDMKVKKVSDEAINTCSGQPYILFYRTKPRPYIS